MAWVHIQTPTAKLYDTPLIGSHAAKIGRVINLYGENCNPDPWIWVYGFFHNLPTLFGSVLKPNWVDIPTQGRHRGRKHGRGLRGFMNLLGQLDAVDPPLPRWVGWRVTGLVERAGYYFLVADATEDFFINWMTTAYQMTEDCPTLDPYGIKTGNGEFPQSSSGWTFAPWATTNSNQMLHYSSGFGILTPAVYNVHWQVRSSPWANTQHRITATRAVYVPASGPLEVLSESTAWRDRSGNGDSWSSGFARGSVTNSGDRILLQMQATGPCHTYGTFQVLGQGIDNVKSDP